MAVTITKKKLYIDNESNLWDHSKRREPVNVSQPKAEFTWTSLETVWPSRPALREAVNTAIGMCSCFCERKKTVFPLPEV